LWHATLRRKKRKKGATKWGLWQGGLIFGRGKDNKGEFKEKTQNGLAARKGDWTTNSKFSGVGMWTEKKGAGKGGGGKRKQRLSGKKEGWGRFNGLNSRWAGGKTTENVQNARRRKEDERGSLIRFHPGALGGRRTKYLS